MPRQQRKKKLTLNGTWMRRKLPKSCIESALHVIQSRRRWKTWRNADTTTNGVGVWAAFGNRLICASRVSGLESELTGVTPFQPNLLGTHTLNESLTEGRGLIVGNARTDDQPFNMHLGAVLQRDNEQILMTDMVEDGPVANAEIETLLLDNTAIETGFRGHDYGDHDVFQLGLLISEEDSAFAGLRNRYGEGQIIDEMD